MPTMSQIARTEKDLREYRKKYLTKKQNLEVDESATRIMVNGFLTNVLNYIELDDIKTEYNIRGEYADYVIQLAGATETTLVRCLDDEVLGLTDLGAATKATVIDIAADHDFTGKSRESLLTLLTKQLGS